MRLVVIESPWRANEAYSIEQHRLYLNYAIQDCFNRGEAPFASHGLYTEALDDDDLPSRLKGITAGLLWGIHADFVAAYCDMGQSDGMLQALRHWDGLGKRIERRTIAPELFRAVLNM